MVSKNIFLPKESLNRNNLDNSTFDYQKPIEIAPSETDNPVTAKNSSFLSIGEGNLLVTNQLDVRWSGLVDGNTFYGGFSVEIGGRVLGTVGHHGRNLVKTTTENNKFGEENITTLVNSTFEK